MILFVFAIWTGGLHSFLNASLPYQILRDIVSGQARVISRLSFSHNAPFLIPHYDVIVDFEALIFLIALIITTYLLNVGLGRKTAILKSLQIASIPLIFLGIWIMIADPGEFFTYVTAAQITYDFLPNFTNFDLLVSSLATFLIASVCLKYYA